MNTPTKLLVVITTSDFGGTESFLERLVNKIDPNLFETTVCSLCPLGRVGQRLEQKGFSVFSLDMAAEARIAELLSCAFRLARHIDSLGIDIVQGLLYRGNVLAALAARLSRRQPKVVAGQRSITPMTGRSAAFAARITRGLTHQTVAVSSAVKGYLVNEEGAQVDKIQVIGNGVDTEIFKPNNRDSARQALGIRADSLLLGAVGRLVPEKGLPFLFEALAALQRSGRSLTAALVGDGPNRESLESQARELDLDLHFLGVRSDLPTLYPGFDIFCLPSLEEGSPQVLLEAMACGCPSVATAVGGVPEVLTAHSQGLLVPAGDSVALEKALQSLIDDPTLRSKLGEEGRRHVVANFDLSQGIKAHEDLYSSLASRP